MASILEKIIEERKKSIEESKKKISFSDLELLLNGLNNTLGFKAALEANSSKNKIIAEVKKASPSKGVIKENFNPLEVAKIYEAAGAAAISVLTEEKFFLGHLDYLKEIRKNVSIPLLRKDFIVDSYQVLEARVSGADAILLIAVCLDISQINELYAQAKELNLDVLLEVHSKEELAIATKSDCKLIGINNRNLHTFKTDLAMTKELCALLDNSYTVVSESGINTKSDIEKLKSYGADAFLIGESIIKEENIGEKLGALL